MRIKVEKEKCSGCHLCEMICSLYHLGVVNTERSAIRIEKDDLDTSQCVLVVCRQCREMKCLEGEETVEEDEKKTFIWDSSRAARCPFGALQAFGEEAYHCDLCSGKPQCVRVCTPGAIIIV